MGMKASHVWFCMLMILVFSVSYSSGQECTYTVQVKTGNCPNAGKACGSVPMSLCQSQNRCFRQVSNLENFGTAGASHNYFQSDNLDIFELHSRNKCHRTCRIVIGLNPNHPANCTPGLYLDYVNVRAIEGNVTKFTNRFTVQQWFSNCSILQAEVNRCPNEAAAAQLASILPLQSGIEVKTGGIYPSILRADVNRCPNEAAAAQLAPTLPLQSGIQGQGCTYRVELKTGGCPNAGKSCGSVRLSLHAWNNSRFVEAGNLEDFGTAGASYNYFQSGNLDIFEIPSRNKCQKAYTIVIRLIPGDCVPGWYLDYAIVQAFDGNIIKYANYFTVYHWFSRCSRLGVDVKAAAVQLASALPLQSGIV